MNIHKFLKRNQVPSKNESWNVRRIQQKGILYCWLCRGAKLQGMKNSLLELRATRWPKLANKDDFGPTIMRTNLFEQAGWAWKEILAHSLQKTKAQPTPLFQSWHILSREPYQVCSWTSDVSLTLLLLNQ